MLRKTNGLASKGAYSGGGQAPLSAVQELIGAIQFGDADVTRFEVGDYDLYLFAIKRPPEANNTTLTEGPRKSVKAGSWEPSALIPRARALLDNIIYGACQVSKVGRDELASKAKSKSLSFARALIAYYANLSGTAGCLHDEDSPE